jgi:hypothetical protein
MREAECPFTRTEAIHARVALRDAELSPERGQRRPVALGLLDVDAECGEAIGGIGVCAVPLAHPAHEVRVLAALPDRVLVANGAFGGAGAAPDVGVRPLHRFPVALDGEGAEPQLLDQEAEEAVLHLIEAAGRVPALAEADDARVADVYRSGAAEVFVEERVHRRVVLLREW